MGAPCHEPQVGTISVLPPWEKRKIRICLSNLLVRHHFVRQGQTTSFSGAQERGYPEVNAGD